MIEIHERIKGSHVGELNDVLELDHIQREKGRLKLESQAGRDVRLFLQRGQVLQKGDVLKSTCNMYLVVSLAKERVVTATAPSWEAFSKACYHLGNRHTRIQIGERWLRFSEDTVLVDLVEQLGLQTQVEQAEFEPESGAYGHGHAGKSVSTSHSDHLHY